MLPRSPGMGALPPCTLRFSPPSLAEGSPAFRAPLVGGLKKGGWGGQGPPPGGSGDVPPKEQKLGASWHLLKPGHEGEAEGRLSRRERGWGKREKAGGHPRNPLAWGLCLLHPRERGKTGGAGGQSPPDGGKWGVSPHESKNWGRAGIS